MIVCKFGGTSVQDAEAMTRVAEIIGARRKKQPVVVASAMGKTTNHLLEAALPGIYLPLYTMITFTRIPYAEAARRARVQDRIVYSGLIFLSILLVAVLLVCWMMR